MEVQEVPCQEESQALPEKSPPARGGEDFFHLLAEDCLTCSVTDYLQMNCVGVAIDNAEVATIIVAGEKDVRIEIPDYDDLVTTQADNCATTKEHVADVVCEDVMGEGLVGCRVDVGWNLLDVIDKFGPKDSVLQECVAKIEFTLSFLETVGKTDNSVSSLRERMVGLLPGEAVKVLLVVEQQAIFEGLFRVDLAGIGCLQATKAAKEEGILRGGGVALLYATRELDIIPTANFDQKTRVQIIHNALKSPIHTIDCNASVEGAIVV
ncbi:chaperonin CPN60-2, mitochondrial-like [Cryptomeria japonica]|uniref:chaperonin CPN60-2, mitochondrial-like n=1 Tax=Cryptomeria japonica TaxID=3369 RepID=UPI0027D9F386|nr:chaperonin CPN60-2, mitochondrial-like [Cryptomeria japonica]